MTVATSLICLVLLSVFAKRVLCNNMNLKILLRVSVVLLFCVACAKSRERSLFPNIALKAGDVVLRCGDGVTSRIVRYADDGGAYSHVGIVVDSAGVMMIVHAVPDEHDFTGDVDRVKMDCPDIFFSSIRTNKGHVLRTTDSVAAGRAAYEAYNLYKRGVLFDHDYDISDTTKMYCSELVEFAYSKAAGISITEGRRRSLNLPAIEYDDVIFPSDFIASGRLQTVATF